MALVTLQQPYKSIRGRNAVVGGQVLFPKGNRNFARVNNPPANPNSSIQQLVRANLTATAQGFSAISLAQKTAWETFAKNYARKDANGTAYPINGQAAYTSVNSYRKLDGQALTATAPSFAFTAAVTAASISGASGTTFVITLTAAASFSGFVLVELSEALPGITRVARPNDCRIPMLAANVAACVLAVVSGTTTTLTLTNSQMRFTYADSDRVGVRLTSLSSNYVKGQQSLATVEYSV
jgi:hypothetical protein